jgi:hypothetical protein
LLQTGHFTLQFGQLPQLIRGSKIQRTPSPEDPSPQGFDAFLEEVEQARPREPRFELKGRIREPLQGCLRGIAHVWGRALDLTQAGIDTSE